MHFFHLGFPRGLFSPTTILVISFAENSIEELMFTDDLVLIAVDQSRLQEMVSNLDQQCKIYGMRISRDKTEVMVHQQRTNSM